MQVGCAPGKFVHHRRTPIQVNIHTLVSNHILYRKRSTSSLASSANNHSHYNHVPFLKHTQSASVIVSDLYQNRSSTISALGLHIHMHSHWHSGSSLVPLPNLTRFRNPHRRNRTPNQYTQPDVQEYASVIDVGILSLDENLDESSDERLVLSASYYLGMKKNAEDRMQQQHRRHRHRIWG